MAENKTARLSIIKSGVKSFCDIHLNDELGCYAQNLCDKLGRKRTISINRGQPEIWCAAIIYVIARMNFLFDRSQEHYISSDTICDFFNVNKSTASQKATLIENNCKLRMGDPNFCNERFTDMFTLIQTPDGIVMPLSYIKKQIFDSNQENASSKTDTRLYTLEVFIVSGPVTQEFVKKNRIISRTIEIMGDQTLEDLHNAIFNAYDREEQHMYEFQFGRGPDSPDAKIYTLPTNICSYTSGIQIAGYVTRTTIGSIGLTLGQTFGYFFDFGDEWIHRIDVVSIIDTAPEDDYPKVTKRLGDSPPQYIECDNQDE